MYMVLQFIIDNSVPGDYQLAPAGIAIAILNLNKKFPHMFNLDLRNFV